MGFANWWKTIVGIQDTIDQITAELATVKTQIAHGFSEIRDKTIYLQNQVNSGHMPDFTEILASVDQLAAQAQALDDLVSDTPHKPIVPLIIPASV